MWFQNRRAKFRKTERLTQHKSSKDPSASTGASSPPPPSSSASPVEAVVGVSGGDVLNNNQLQNPQHRIKTEASGIGEQHQDDKKGSCDLNGKDSAAINRGKSSKNSATT